MISQKDLSLTLRNDLRKSGVVNSLTAQLRADFVKKMKRGSSSMALSSSNKENKPATSLTLEDRAVRSLILDYLKSSSLNHSLSVFAPESGVAESALSSEESLKSLGFSQLSPTYKDVTSTSEHPTLKRVLNHLASTSAQLAPSDLRAAQSSSSSTPIGPASNSYTAAESLVEKLNLLQKQHEDAINETRMKPDKNFEEKMLTFQKECEDRLTKQMQRDVERIRKHDIEMMRLEEQARYRGELQALRLEMKAEYDLRSQKSAEMQERKFQNAKLQAQQIEAAQYQARQEVVRELESVRRRELDNRRELDIRKHALELDEQRLSNLKKNVEGKQGELERMETSMKHKYQKEYELAREEAKKTYTAATEAIAAQQKTLDLELSNVRREREGLRKFKEDLAEKHSNVLNNDTDVGTIMMERDSLKVKLAECESQLQAFHIQYEEEHKEEESAASPSPVDGPPGGRSRNLSMSSNPMSRSWKDHRNALEGELERCERELEETKHLLESERSSLEALREKERSTFEKAATLEAVANSLKLRLEESEKKFEDALAEKEEASSENDAMKTELSEMRQLMAKQQSLVDLASRGRKRATESKDATREARLERVRQRAREQMKNDTGVLAGAESGERRLAGGETSSGGARANVPSAASEPSTTRIVWDNGRPIAVTWDSKLGGLVLQESAGSAQSQTPTAASSANSAAIAKLEARLAQTEIASEKFQVLLQAEREKSKTQLETFSMMRVLMGQAGAAAPLAQQVLPQTQTARFDLPPPPPLSTPTTSNTTPEVVISPVAKLQQNNPVVQLAPTQSEVPIAAAPPVSPTAATTTKTSSSASTAAATTAAATTTTTTTTTTTSAQKPAGWEKEYQDYLIEQEATEKEQQLAMRKKQEEISKAKAELTAREKAAAEQAMLQREEEKAAAALRQAAEDKAAMEAKTKAEKEEEERRKWEAKEEARREKKRVEQEKEREEKERREREREEARIMEEKRRKAAMMIQTHQRRNSAGIIYRELLQKKRESMNAAEKEKLEREKEEAVEAMRREKAEKERRAKVEKEHEEARARAAERMRARAEREAEERRAREEEERERERRMSEGGGGTDSDQLEVSDGSMESDSSNPSYDDW